MDRKNYNSGVMAKKKTLKLLSDNRQNVLDYSMINCPANLKKKPGTIVLETRSQLV